MRCLGFASMAAEQRRVAAETSDHAQALAQNLAKRGFVVESQTAAVWTLRKARRRGDIVVTISISRPSQRLAPLRPPSPPSKFWPPPSGPPAT